MPKPVILAVFLAISSLSASAQIAEFTFDNRDLRNSANSGLATISDLSSPLANLFGTADNRRMWCTTSDWRSTSRQGPSNNSHKYIEFRVTPNGTCPIALTSLEFVTWRGNTDPDVIEFADVYADEDLGAGGDNFQTRIASADIYPQHSGAGTTILDLSGFAPLQAITRETKIRIYLWGDQNAGHSNAEIDNIRLNGQCAPTPPTGPCVPVFASHVVGSQQGSNPASGGEHPSNVLGDTPNTYFSLGVDGWIIVEFPRLITNTGDNIADIFVDEHGSADCWTLRLFPADQATTNALANSSSFRSRSGGFYELQQVFCGDAAIDLDAILPGLPQGTLQIRKVKIYDADQGQTSNGAEINRISGNVCERSTLGDLVWLDVNCDGIRNGNDAGIPNVTVRLLNEARNTVIAEVTTGSDGLYTFNVEPGNYFLEFLYDATTIFPTGLRIGSDPTKDSDVNPLTNLAGPITVGPGERKDDIDAGFCSVNTARVCEHIFATEVLFAQQGANPISGNSDPARALGNDTGTYFSLGRGGVLAVAFGRNFTTSGNGQTDLYINEFGASDCYTVGLRPADAMTRAQLVNAGLVGDAMDFFDLPTLYCSEVSIDLDAIIAGQPLGRLQFSGVRITDDGSSGDGSEIIRVSALVCNDGRIGNFVFLDANCDGVQGLLEIGLMGISVELLAADGQTVLQQMMTAPDGTYAFSVAPGVYFVRFQFNQSLVEPSPFQVGGDMEKDSDINPQTGLAGPIVVGPNAVRNDIDAGLCAICTGVQARVIESPSACSIPNEPVFTATVPAIGSMLMLLIQSPILPDAEVFIFAQFGPANPFPINTGTNICNLYVDPMNLAELLRGRADANGDFLAILPVPIDPVLVGIQITLQARVCLPSIPGPIPGFPDWLTNAVELTLGCP